MFNHVIYLCQYLQHLVWSAFLTINSDAWIKFVFVDVLFCLYDLKCACTELRNKVFSACCLFVHLTRSAFILFWLPISFLLITGTVSAYLKPKYTSLILNQPCITQYASCELIFPRVLDTLDWYLTFGQKSGSVFVELHPNLVRQNQQVSLVFQKFW